jgi:hypothetical protein
MNIKQTYYFIKIVKQNQNPVGGDCHHTIFNSIYKTKFQSFFMPIIGAMAIALYGSKSLSARFYFMRILFNGALKTVPYRFSKNKNHTNTTILSETKI